MPQGSFKAQVSAWAAKCRERMEIVHRESAQRVISLAQTPVGQGGNMPIDTGFLRASLDVRIGADLPALKAKPDGVEAFAWNPSEITLVLAGATPDQPVTAVWTANYARHVEYGGENRVGRRFVGLAAQQWPQIVADVVAEAKARTGGS